MKTAVSDHLPLRLKTLIRRLIAKRAMVTSQAGQDFWVFEAFDEKRRGYFVDIGAHDGVELSNTYLLEERYMWSGLCVEANPFTYKQLLKNRRVTCENACLDRQIGTVNFRVDGVMGGIIGDDLDNKVSDGSTAGVVALQTITLESLLDSVSAPKTIDYLTIDVEGAEARILGDFDFNRYRFLCMTIERPSEKIVERLISNDYVLVKCIPGLDSFFIHKSFSDTYFSNVMNFYARKRNSFSRT